jgi:pimeloyl-ACP methyl ester carboxylesterase
VGVASTLGVERFAYVGWSWGASIGVHLAARFGSRLTSLVLLDGGHTDIPGDPDRTLDEVLVDVENVPERYRSANWDTFLEPWRAKPFWRPALEERLRAGMREAGGEVVAAADRRAAAAAWHGLLQEQPSSAFEPLGASSVPVLLVLASANDTREEAARFRTAVPRVETTSVESGHDLFAEAPVETISTVARWLGRTVNGKVT